jgi:DNA-binding MarR family transcriptional regulator
MTETIELRPGARRVLAALRRLCDDTPKMSASGGWYAMAKLAEHSGMTVGACGNYVDQLVRAGLIESRQRPARVGRAWEYRINRRRA